LQGFFNFPVIWNFGPSALCTPERSTTLLEYILPHQHIDYARDGGSFDEGAAMVCGTLAAIGGIQPADRFEFELENPVVGPRLVHGYDMQSLPVAG
jgi:hypothetical protein